MENGIKFLTIGAAIVIALVLISFGFLMMRTGQDTGKVALSKTQQLNAEVMESDIKLYDAMEISGSEVVNVIQKFKSETYGVKVVTGKDTTGTWYIYTVTEASNNALGGVSSAPIANALDETNSKYINPNGNFEGKVLRDLNGAITGIIFTQK